MIYVAILFLLLFLLAGRASKGIGRVIFRKSSLDQGTRESVSSLLRYVLILAGVFVILQTAGIDLSAITVALGTLGIGIGLGLQNITSSMVSGFVILLERPIKVGDRIDVGDIRGNVLEISLRSTVVLTNDNVAIIVPNSEFTSQRVINWSYTDRNVRLSFPVGVSYKADPEAVREALLEVGTSTPGILSDPAPDVLLDSFGDNSVNFILRAWTRDYSQRPGKLRSEVNFAISAKFKQRGIEIPFPQRDLHLKSVDASTMALLKADQ